MLLPPGVFVAQKLNNNLQTNFISLNPDGLVCNNPDQITYQTTIKSTKCAEGGNDQLYCCGGAHQTNGGSVDHCHKYDYSTDTWTKIPNAMPHKRWGGALVTLANGNLWYTGKLYIEKAIAYFTKKRTSMSLFPTLTRRKIASYLFGIYKNI